MVLNVCSSLKRNKLNSSEVQRLVIGKSCPAITPHRAPAEQPEMLFHPGSAEISNSLWEKTADVPSVCFP